jgi:hypothetical protein
LYGFVRSWFAAQIARLTAAGASSGAAANPKSKRAEFPATVGPEAGKVSELADEPAMQVRLIKAITEILRFTGVSEASPMPDSVWLESKKLQKLNFRPHRGVAPR